MDTKRRLFGISVSHCFFIIQGCKRIHLNIDAFSVNIAVCTFFRSTWLQSNAGFSALLGRKKKARYKRIVEQDLWFALAARVRQNCLKKVTFGCKMGRGIKKIETTGLHCDGNSVVFLCFVDSVKWLIVRPKNSILPYIELTSMAST